MTGHGLIDPILTQKDIKDIDVVDPQTLSIRASHVFNIVSGALRAAYPEETASLTIMNLNQNGIRTKLRMWAKDNHVDLGDDPEHAIALLAHNSFVLTGDPPLIGIHTNLSEPMFLRTSLLKQAGSRVFHEFAHLALKVAKPETGDLDTLEDYAKHIRSESAADLFSSIHSLRLGWINQEDIMSFANSRAFNMLLGDIEHADFRALDWLADQIHEADWTKMSPDQIRKFVEITAKNFMPRQGEIIDASDCFEDLRATLGDNLDDYSNPTALRKFFAKNQSKMTIQIDAFYDMLEDMHRMAPAQSLVHQATAKILGETIRGNHRFLPPYPASRDGGKIIGEILQRSTEKKSTAFMDRRIRPT